MIRVEKIENAWDVQMKVEKPAEEFALVAAAMMRVLSPETMIEIIEGAKKLCPEIINIDKHENSMFFLRLSHLLEINRLNLKGLCQELQLPKEDYEDLNDGIIPSIEAVDKIAKRFAVSQDYLLGDIMEKNETDKRTD